MKIGGKRNYGYGKQLEWAGKQAIIDHFIGDRFASTAAHVARWKVFSDWLVNRGIRDVRDVSIDLILDYGGELAELVRDEEMRVSYAQNLLSTANVVLGTMRHDKNVWVSPSTLVGQRTNFRIEPPIHMDWDQVGFLQSRLVVLGYPVVAALVGLSRTFGARFRECCLLDAIGAQRQAKRSGKIKLSQGTKGGQDRIITAATEKELCALSIAAGLQTGICLIPVELNFVTFRNHVYTGFYLAGGKRFHDFRAAHACDIYAFLTGCPAPVLWQDGDPSPSKESDREVRLMISEQLGHHRVDVVGAYIGPILRQRMGKK
jgi:hypothetical protein